MKLTGPSSKAINSGFFGVIQCGPQRRKALTTSRLSNEAAGAQSEPSILWQDLEFSGRSVMHSMP